MQKLPSAWGLKTADSRHGFDETTISAPRETEYLSQVEGSFSKCVYNSGEPEVRLPNQGRPPFAMEAIPPAWKSARRAGLSSSSIAERAQTPSDSPCWRPIRREFAATS